MGSYFDNPSPSIVARYNTYIELSQDSILFVKLTHGNASQRIICLTVTLGALKIFQLWLRQEWKIPTNLCITP